MEKPEIENARISGTMLGIEDHGIMTAFVYCEMNGTSCGFGGYGLDGPYSDVKKERLPNAALGLFIKRTMETVGVEKWEDLKGTHCRVETTGPGGGITRIGHFIRNNWFDPKKELAALREKP